VRSFAEISAERQIGFWDNILDMLSRYFPFLAKYSDTVLDEVVFNVNIEPQTQAKVVLPNQLTDLDGRILANALSEFHIRIGSMDEVIRTPKNISFFEKNVDNLHLPVGIVNLNQKLSIRKSGVDAKNWTPIRDVTTMINLIRAYSRRGDFRSTPQYVSPMEQLSVPTNVVDQELTGTKNRPTVLQFPFAKADQPATAKPDSGLYAIEVSSPSYEAAQSNAGEERFYNPKYVLAQVTDLSIQLKRGTSSSVAWVTRLSNAQPVAGAKVEIYNCQGVIQTTLTTDANGLASFTNKKWAQDCKTSEDDYDSYSSEDEYFAVAKQDQDMALIHSSWTSSNSYAMSAPGVEWFSSDIRENRANFHAIIGVNLVKPGQQVPVEIVAKIPDQNGFREVAAADLPKLARIESSDDPDTFYEFPLQWKDGQAQILWNVPNDSAVHLGRYTVLVKTASDFEEVPTGDIEVAEFKVPLMTGIIAFPNETLVQPSAIPVSTVIRYANGVGAKNLAADVSFYFSPTSFQVKDLAAFTFGTGPVRTSEGGMKTSDALPSNSRPATLQGQKTNDDGSLSEDVAKEAAADGRSIADVLKSVEQPQKLVVRVRYKDQIGEYQTLSQAKDIFNSNVYVGTNLVAGARADAKLQVAIVDVKSKNVTSIEDLDLKVIRIETQVIGEELFGGLIKNTLETELKPVHWTPNCSIQKGVVSCPVGALKSGSYAFQATSKSSKQSAHSLFKVGTDGRIYSPQDYFNFGDDEGNHQLPLALDKKMYRDHEKAVVSFAPPFKSCSALVTIERSDVIKSYVVANACEKGQVQVPVEATMAPNVFVSIYAVTGRADSTAPHLGETDLGRPTYRLGFANMKVNWSRFKSSVKVQTNKDKYQPGETVQVTATVQPEEGQLKGATVTFVALEEKILDLKKNPTYSILSSLMQMRDDQVQTVTALERIETVTVDNADLPSAAARKGGDEGGDGSSASEFKRKLFNALVAFQGSVPVVNGVAKFSFKANDSLTRFKIFAISTDSSQKFGTGDAVYLTEKDTQAYSNIPSVAHSGDVLPVQVTVQNNSSGPAKYKAEVTATVKGRDGKVITQKTFTKETTIGKSESTSIDVGQMTIDNSASRIEYTVRVYDQNGKVVDEMSPDAQVILASVPVTVHDSLLSQLENGTLTKTLVKDPSALPGQGEIRVTAAKSFVASAIVDIGQRMDRDTFADFFIESRFNKALLKSSEANPSEIKGVLETLQGYTDGAGFVKYYPQATRGSVWLTASILNALKLEPWAVKYVPVALVEKWKGAVSQVLTKSVQPAYVGSTPMDWMRAQVVMGQAAFALKDAELIDSAKAVNTAINESLAQNPAAFGEPMEKWTNSDLVERWLLEVDATPKTATAAASYKSLISAARLIYTGNMAALKGAPRYDLFYSDETIETSKLLLGHARVKGDKTLAKALALAMVNANIKAWYNNSTMTKAAQGLKEFGRSYDAEPVSGIAQITLPELQKSAAVDFDKKLTGGLTSDWAVQTATVKVVHGGHGQPWVSIQALSAIPLTAARGQGLSIEKSIRNVTQETGYHSGDMVEVTIKIQASNAIHYIALMDPIPAGSNILAEAYGDYTSGQKSYSGYKLYFEMLPAGLTTVKYQYQLNNPGSFNLPPTHAEGLYAPDVFGEAPNTTLKVD
jgi:uncharacterized protein YfaS (alpha-2-macroglobulin family)